MRRQQKDLLQAMERRLERIDREAELTRSILIVKEPSTGLAAEAYDGLRKQVAASAAERRSHLNQLTTMAVAVNRATSVDDLRPQVREWLEQAGIRELVDVPRGAYVQDVFEDADGGSLAGAGSIEVIEPAYVDVGTGVVLRLGRAPGRTAARRGAAPVDPDPVAVDPPRDLDEEEVQP